MELKDILSLAIPFLGVVATIVAAFFAYKSKNAADRSADAAYRSADAADRSARNEKDAMQLQKKLESVNFAAQALKEFSADKDMQDVFYDIEYREFEYPGGNKGSPEERRADRLLRHFAAVALAWENGLVKPGDLVLIRYYVVKIMSAPNAMQYVDKVCRSRAKGNIEHPYAVLKRFYLELEKPSGSSNFSGTAG